MEEWITTFAAARLSRLHPNHIRRLLRSGAIRGRKWGLSWQVDRHSLIAYLEKMRISGEKRGPKTGKVDN